MGGMHAQIYGQLPEAEIVAVVDPDLDAARAKMADLGMEARLFATLSEALASVEADFVDVCFPTFLHEEAVLEAIAAGKDVFCEKPLATSEQGGEAMVAAAESAGITFMVGHCIRFWPEYVAFKQLVDSGKAGRLLSLTMQRRSARPTYSKDNWLQDAGKSCGAALDLHIHDTDFVLHLLGRPASVQSHGVRDDAGWSHIITHYQYDGGPEIQAEGGWNYPNEWGFQMAFQAVFEGGSMEYDSNATPTTRIIIGAAAPVEAEMPKAEAGESQLGEGNLSDLGGYLLELTHFIECLETGSKPETSTGTDALASLKTTFAEIRSAESGQPESVNP